MEIMLEDYVGAIQEWARRKLGADGDDLAQEVLLQVCISLSAGRTINDMEHYIWKTARYTWYNWLRSRKKTRMICSIDDTVLPTDDFADAYAENDEDAQLKKRLRHEIGGLMKRDRELMVAHYIDGMSIAEAAHRAGITETSAAWKLHEARRKVRERLMKSIESYAYQPGRLSVGICGDPGPERCDAFEIRGNLIRENILLVCFGRQFSAKEISEITGVPMCYIERDIDWLCEREFLVNTGKKYQTAFPINDRAHTDMLNGIYGEFADAYAAAAARINAAESKIRAMGFYGDDFEWKRLLWPLLMIFASTCIRTSKILEQTGCYAELPKHPDGGVYQTVGSVIYEDEDIWHGYNGLVSIFSGYGKGAANVLWLGAYNFAENLPRIVVNLGGAKDSALFDMYISMTNGTFDKNGLSSFQQDVLARDIAEGMITSELKPDFVVIESEKLERLRNEIFAPIACETVLPALESIKERLLKYSRSKLPAGMKHLADFESVQDMSQMCYRILEYAGRNDMLYLPADEAEGGKLTLILVK